ncbi:Putative nuclease YhcG [Methanimicrococcus hongohii]|uniref:Nuclease YhcG n=1 Tax=Methanimicrococcus hongohii TaxID=3028295 RepID=A0AA97A2B1_9EURY|nr:PDDEXK nuclease domain-containing protein [Methanimicrococcus sp. Hf6]WNY23948.1 Putative nuclease YhcG [Methanimicrococcus sp. Hf6]
MTKVLESFKTDNSYSEFIAEVKSSIQNERMKAVISANRHMIILYWKIGSMILEKQKEAGWGAKVIDQISIDLKQEFPDMKGFSSRNLKYMKRFAECWEDFEIVQQAVAQLPWRSNILILDKLHDKESRLWYVYEAINNGWSSSILDLQISSDLIHRQNHIIHNFSNILPPAESDLVSHIFKDPYLFDFLGTDELKREKELEMKLIQHIEHFLLELGQGFAFVGRQVKVEIGGQEFFVDLLFYHLRLRCYIVVELKTCDFEPGHIAQLNLYQNIIDDTFRHSDDKLTIGLLLVKSKNKVIVEYSLAGFQKPIGVAEWKQQMIKELPENLLSDLPTIQDIEEEMKKEIGMKKSKRAAK